MATKAKLASAYPFYVNIVGKSEADGAMKGFDTLADAKMDRDDRNSRAKEMGVSARYEVRESS